MRIGKFSVLKYPVLKYPVLKYVVLKYIVTLTVLFMLTACVSQVLFGDTSSKLMWALLKPLVGFDPNEVNLFENPLIKDRMVSFLGDKYEPTMKLLKTAQEIKQEGALFYVASKFAPKEVKAITDKAGLIWNAETNQMAVMLIKDGTPQILSEPVAAGKKAITAVLPKELQTAYDAAIQVQEQKKSLEKTTLDSTLLKNTTLENPIKESVPAVPAEKSLDNLPPVEDLVK